jgi:transcriptional regulator with XRE-family HTH domain
MENPLNYRRLNVNYTQDQLAERAGVTHDNIVRNEQGLYSSPSPKVMAAIVELSGDDPVTVLLEYRNWVAWKRRQEPIRGLVRRIITFPPGDKLTSHPFLLWRNALGIKSRIDFCKMLCVHPATVLKYESNLQKNMPVQIYDALVETGMSAGRIQEIAQLGAEFFKNERRRRSASKTA